MPAQSSLAEPTIPPLVATEGVKPKLKGAPFHIPSLDGLRAVSFLIVFIAHAGLDRVFPGGFGVTVFFFLSGYLITTLMRQEVGKTGRISFKKFYLRRALRILPPFYLVLILATLGAAAGVVAVKPSLSPIAVGAQALHFTNYWIATHNAEGIADGTMVYWSLAVEEHFYFVFPALYLLLVKAKLDGRHKAMVVFGLCALVLAWRCVLVFGLHSPTDRTYLCSDTRVDSILYGCALAVWNNPMIDDAERSSPPSPIWMTVLLPLSIVTLLATFLVRDEAFRETFRYSLQGLALFPFFAAAIRHPSFLLFRPLQWRPLRFLGTLSYSLYLVHHVILGVVSKKTELPVIAQGVLALGLSVLLAYGIYLAVEKPCARLRRKLSV